MKKLSKKKRNKLAKTKHKLTKRDKTNLKKLANVISEVETKPTGELYIKFKSDVILDTPGSIALMADGFNVQYATQIHFNPEFQKDMFLDMIKNDSRASSVKLVENVAHHMEKELTKEEVMEVVDGVSKISLPTLEHKCEDHDHTHHATEQQCDKKECDTC